MQDHEIDEATEARPDTGQDPFHRTTALIPVGSIAGRALVTVIAIMTYLAALTAGVALAIGDTSRAWTNDVSREMTIQIRPATGRDLDAEAQKAADLARAARGIAEVRVVSKDESERLLQPWLGSGLDLGELPIPRLVVLRLAPDTTPDLDALRRGLRDKVPGASLDDHGSWSLRLGAMAFATTGAMAGTREIISVLHFVGAEDRFIAAEFRRHFLRLGLRGALIGAVAAIATFYAAGVASAWWVATPGGEQIEALFGHFGLGATGYVAIAAIAVAVAGLTGLMSRAIVLRQLRDLVEAAAGRM